MLTRALTVFQGSEVWHVLWLTGDRCFSRAVLKAFGGLAGVWHGAYWLAWCVWRLYPFCGWIMDQFTRKTVVVWWWLLLLWNYDASWVNWSVVCNSRNNLSCKQLISSLLYKSQNKAMPATQSPKVVHSCVGVTWRSVQRVTVALFDLKGFAMKRVGIAEAPIIS